MKSIEEGEQQAVVEDDVLKKKRILIVDDEKDVLDTLEEILDECVIDTALSFETAEQYLTLKHYDAIILDIMGVNGYELLNISIELKIPVIMLTAHALSMEHFKKSIDRGAFAYIPKDKMAFIDLYLSDLLHTHQESGRKSGNWFSHLRAYFEKKFGSGWFTRDEVFRRNFDNEFLVTKEYFGNIFS